MNQAEQDLLVLSAQNGNQKAFGLLFKLFHKPLVNFAFKLSGDKEMAYDSVQESWMKIAKNIRKLRDPRAFKSWIYRLVRWRVLDQLRVKKRDSNRLEPLDDHLAIDEQGEQIDTNTDDKDQVSSLLSQLPATEKEIIHLFYLEEMKITEISIVLEIPTGTVKSRLNRARKLLQAKCKSQEI